MPCNHEPEEYWKHKNGKTHAFHVALMKGFILLAGVIGSIALEAKVEVESDFPGGSVVVDQLDEETRTLRFRPMNYKNKGCLETYTMLSIGDGLVTQVPAIIVSIAAGILVTRSSEESNLGEFVD